jgi:transposase
MKLNNAGTKRSVSLTVGCAHQRAEPHAEGRASGLSAKSRGRQTMDEGITSFVGLDVHKDTIAVAVAEAGREAPRFVGTTTPATPRVLKVLASLGEPDALQIVYEAGPSGYTLARELRTRGYRCEVIAASKNPRPATDRIKTDRRDALTLARLARSSDLVSVVVPDERDEAIRDLSRAREDALGARLKARQQLKALLLRHGHRYTGRTYWSAAHERTLASISFGHSAQTTAFGEYRLAVRDAQDRLDRITQALRDECEHWRMKNVVAGLVTLRGIDFVAAVTLVAEIGDFRRFAHPRDLMGFLGLVPSEFSTGQSRHRGAITKTGNGHARRVLIEAAWNYRHPARISRKMQARQEGQPKNVRDIAWRAQLRLGQRYRRLSSRKLHQNKICVAIARELAGFVWAVAAQITVAA